MNLESAAHLMHRLDLTPDRWQATVLHREDHHGRLGRLRKAWPARRTGIGRLVSSAGRHPPETCTLVGLPRVMSRGP